MSGAEALVVLGVAASVAQFIEFANELTKQVHDFVTTIDETPAVLRDITVQLPLLVNICESFDSVDENDPSSETLCTVLTHCLNKLKDFSSLTRKLSPTAQDSKAKRAWKAVKHAFHYENKVSEFQKTLESFKGTLILYCSNEIRNAKLRPSVEDPVVKLPQWCATVTRWSSLKAVDREIDAFADTHVGPRIVTIQGMGGQGKTRLALDYAYRQQGARKFSHIHWLDASSQEALIRSYEDVADHLAKGRKVFTDSESQVKFVKEKLAGCPWLLVLDNLDTPKDFPSLSKVLPPGNGLVLVTSRHEDTRFYGRTVRLKKMEEGEAMELLLRNTSYNASSKKVRDEAIKIIDKLGGLPLALDQASAYISAQSLPLELFLPHYEKMKHIVVNQKRLDWDYFAKLSLENNKDNSMGILATWELSFQQISIEGQRRECVEHFLTIAAFLGNATIHERLFRTYHAHRKHELAWCRIFTKGHSWDSMAFRSVMAELSRLSLLQLQNSGTECEISLHPLIRDWLQMRRTVNDRIKIIAETTMIVATFINHTSPDGLQSAYRHILEHQDACCFHDLAHHEHPGRLGFGELRDSAVAFTRFYNLHGRNREAQRPMENVVRHDRDIHGYDHSVTLVSVRGLADVYLQSARYDEAETLLSSAASVNGETRKIDDIENLRLLASLGDLHKLRDRKEEAEIFYEKAIERFRAHPDAHEDDSLLCLEKLAEVKRFMNKIPDCTKIYAQVKMAYEKRVSGANIDSPELSRVLGKLGDLFRSQGQYELAEQTYARVYRAYQYHYGKDHPHTALICTNLAIACRNQEKFLQAERYFDEAIVSFQRVRGEDHPETLRGIMNKAVCMDKQADYAKAELHYRIVLKGRREKLGYTHYTLRTTERLTWMLWKQGKAQQAEDLATEIVVLAKQATIEDLRLRGETLSYPGLDNLYRNSMVRHLEKYRWDHVDCVETYECLSDLCHAHGQYDEEHALKEKIVRARAAEHHEREKARRASDDIRDMFQLATPTAQVIEQPLQIINGASTDPEKQQLAVTAAAAGYATGVGGATTASSSSFDQLLMLPSYPRERRRSSAETLPPPPSYEDVGPLEKDDGDFTTTTTTVPGAPDRLATKSKSRRGFVSALAQEWGLNTPAGIVLAFFVVFSMGWQCAGLVQQRRQAAFGGGGEAAMATVTVTALPV